MFWKCTYIWNIGLNSTILFLLLFVVNPASALQEKTISEQLKRMGLRLENGMDDPNFRRLVEHVSMWPDSGLVLAENVDVSDIIKSSVIPQGADVRRESSFGRVRFRWTDEKMKSASHMPVWREELAGLMFAEFMLCESAEIAQWNALLEISEASIYRSGDYHHSVVISPSYLSNGIIITNRSVRSFVIVVYHNLFFKLMFQPREGGVVPDEDVEYIQLLVQKFSRELSKQNLVKGQDRAPIARYLGREIINAEASKKGRLQLKYDAKYDEYKKTVLVFQGDKQSSPSIREDGRKLIIDISLPCVADTISLNIRAESQRGHVFEDNIAVHIEDWMESMLHGNTDNHGER